MLSLIFMAFVFVVGLISVNTVMMVASRVSAQRAADASALAACRDLPVEAAARITATDYAELATRNNTGGTTAGYIEGGNYGTVVTVSTTTFTNDTVRVDVKREQRLIGLPSAGYGPRRIPAHAICRRAESSVPALLALDGTRRDTLNISGGSTLYLGNNGIIVNSTNPAALSVSGGAVLQGAFIDTASGTGQLIGTVTLDPPVAQGTMPDPYAGVPEPTLTLPPTGATGADNRPNCDYDPSTAPLDGQTSPRDPTRCYHRGTSGTFTACTDTMPRLRAGVYWGGLELGDRSGTGIATTVCLEGGIYYLAGGGGAESARGSGGLFIHDKTTVIGAGVLFFNGRDPSGSPTPERNCGPIHVERNVDLRLSPYTAAPPYDELHLLFFQDRTSDTVPSTAYDYDTVGCTATATFDSGTTIGLAPPATQGAIYIRNGDLNFTAANTASGDPAVTIYSSFVANRINISGDVAFGGFIPSGTIIEGSIGLVE